MHGPRVGRDLEHLTNPSLDVLEADQADAEGEKRLVDVGATFVANSEATKSMKPSKVAFHDPTVPTEALLRLDALASDAINDAADAARASTPLHVVPLVAVQLRRPLARRTSPRLNRRHRVDHRSEHLRVVHVGRRQRDGQRYAFSVDDQVVFAARSPAICGVRPGLLAPLFAGT